MCPQVLTKFFMCVNEIAFYSGQWGTPTVGVSALIGMVAATMSSVVESRGDYIATATVGYIR